VIWDIGLEPERKIERNKEEERLKEIKKER